MANFQIGDVIAFNYPAVHQDGTRAHDKHPNLLVLHTNYKGLVHGINFNWLTQEEINSMRMLLDPGFEMKYRASMAKHPEELARFDSIINKADNTNIISPKQFYEQVVRPFLGIRGRRFAPSPPPDKDAYRLYRPEKMTGVRIMQRRSFMTGEEQPGFFERYKNKIQGYRGPRFPTFKERRDYTVQTQNDTPTTSLPKGPGALPGSRGPDNK